MTDANRESAGDKLKRNMKPESEKGIGEKASDYATDTYESVAGKAQPDSEKSTTQKATDFLASDDSSSKSYTEQAKDAMGLNKQT